MPIRADQRARYPEDWAAISARIRHERAGDRCECDGRCRSMRCPAYVVDPAYRRHRCTARNGEPHPSTGSVVVLTVAHLDHVPEHSTDDNLLALCQCCHLAYDADHHRETRAAAMTDQPALFTLPRLSSTRPAGPWAAMQRTAVLSDDLVYRYTLVRAWNSTLPWLGWVMLNPSTADATMDDPTVVRIVNFSHAWGYGAAVVCNLFALRSTAPAGLLAAADPVGPGNDAALRTLAGQDVVCAWGDSTPRALRGWNRAATVTAHLRDDYCRLYHLGLTAAGSPRHPVRLPNSTERVLWPAP